MIFDEDGEIDDDPDDFEDDENEDGDDVGDWMAISDPANYEERRQI